MPVQGGDRQVREVDLVPAVGVVADQDVEVPEQVGDGGHEALHGRRVAQVGGHVDQPRGPWREARRSVEEGVEVLADAVLLGVMGAVVVHRQRGTHLGEARGDGEPDAHVGG